MNKICELFIYFFCFFPFIKLFDIGSKSDTQPFALLISGVFLIYAIIRNKKILINRSYIGFYILILFATIIAFASIGQNSLFTIARSYCSYLSISLIPLATYRVLSISGNITGINEKLIKLFINFWLIVGVIQKIINSTFLNFLLSNARTTSNRGVISLACEPSFYGYMCIFFIFFILDFKSKKIFYICNVLFQIVMLAQSSVSIIYLLVIGIFVIIEFIFSLKLKNLFLILIMGIFAIKGIVIWSSLNIKTRMGYLINTIFSEYSIKKILYLIKKDKSIADRIEDIILCIKEFIHDFGIPHGYTFNYRIKSGYGSFLYEMGLLGLILIVLFWFIIYHTYNNKKSIILANSITVIMFSAIPLSTPIFGFFLGYCMYNNKIRNRHKNNDEVST